MLVQPQAWGLTPLPGKKERKGHSPATDGSPQPGQRRPSQSHPGKLSFANSQQLKPGSKLRLFRATILILKNGVLQQNSLFLRTMFPFANLFLGQDQSIKPILLMFMVQSRPHPGSPIHPCNACAGYNPMQNVCFRPSYIFQGTSTSYIYYIP